MPTDQTCYTCGRPNPPIRLPKSGVAVCGMCAEHVIGEERLLPPKPVKKAPIIPEFDLSEFEAELDNDFEDPSPRTAPLFGDDWAIPRR